MALFELNIWAQLIIFPIVTLGLWTLLFNSQNSMFTKMFVEGGYMLLVVPLVILTFLSVPGILLFFWANAANVGSEVTTAFLIVFVGITLIIEYYYIKRMITQIEERENMPFREYISKQFDSEYREAREKKKVKTKEEATEFFDEISEMNKKRREEDREEKEKLRRALLGEVDSEQKSQ